MTIVNLPRQESKSATSALKYRIWMARVRDEVDMATFPTPTAGIIAALDLDMVLGKGFHYIDCIPNTIKPNAKSVGDVAPLGQLEVTAEVAGLTADTIQFLYDQNGEEMILIWEHCETGKKFIAGGACGGVKFSYAELGVLGDYSGAKLSWKGYPTSGPFFFFDGAVPVVP